MSWGSWWGDEGWKGLEGQVGESGQEGSFLWRLWDPQGSAPNCPEPSFGCDQAEGPDFRSAERPGPKAMAASRPLPANVALGDWLGGNCANSFLPSHPPWCMPCAEAEPSSQPGAGALQSPVPAPSTSTCIGLLGHGSEHRPNQASGPAELGRE